MNHGKFFSLDLGASRVEEGIAVYNYTDIFDAEVNENHAQTPRYPIFVSITSDTVKFILQYCVYNQDNGTFVPSLDLLTENSNTQIRHMEEVLVELPLTDSIESSLTARLKRLYTTPFPIDLKGEHNYILDLIKKRYESSEESVYLLKRNGEQKDINYSSLPVWDLYNRKCDNPSFVLYNNDGKYEKVLRKLILDFFFDMMHSDVFKNSVHYDTMYSRFMSNFFCSSIISKAEYYYQRALVNDLVNELRFNNQSLPNSITIYAQNLDKAEMNWVKCIQSSESDSSFEFQPQWFEKGTKTNSLSQTGLLKKISNCLDSIGNGLRNLLAFKPIEVFKIYNSWFTVPEEELMRMYYLADHDTISSSDDLYKMVNRADNIQIPLSWDASSIKERISSSAKWLLKRYNFRDAYGISFSFGANTLLILLLVAFISWIFSNISILSTYISSIAFTMAFIIMCILLIKSIAKWCCIWAQKIRKRVFKKYDIFKMLLGNLHFLYPRLIASITAAWFTITLGEDLFKAFFDAKINWVVWLAIVVFIWGFVVYEVHRIVPKIGLLRKLGRALQLIIISFAISLAVGICVINFTGDRMLVRSGILPKAFRDDVLIHTGDNPNGDPKLVLNFSKIAADSAIWSDSIVMNHYTHSPYGLLDSIGAALAVRQFADTPYDNTYMQRVANIYIPKDSLITDNTPTDLADSISLVRGRFLLNHDNSLLFKDLLPYVEHREDNHPVAKILPLFGGNYKLFLLHDFLIQFAVIAMFIGIFIQMIFEEKNVTES